MTMGGPSAWCGLRSLDGLEAITERAERVPEPGWGGLAHVLALRVADPPMLAA